MNKEKKNVKGSTILHLSKTDYTNQWLTRIIHHWVSPPLMVKCIRQGKEKKQMLLNPTQQNKLDFQEHSG